jgi:hypothetical protein
MCFIPLLISHGWSCSGHPRTAGSAPEISIVVFIGLGSSILARMTEHWDFSCTSIFRVRVNLHYRTRDGSMRKSLCRCTCELRRLSLELRHAHAGAYNHTLLLPVQGRACRAGELWWILPEFCEYWILCRIWPTFSAHTAVPGRYFPNTCMH